LHFVVFLGKEEGRNLRSAWRITWASEQSCLRAKYLIFMRVLWVTLTLMDSVLSFFTFYLLSFIIKGSLLRSVAKYKLALMGFKRCVVKSWKIYFFSP